MLLYGKSVSRATYSAVPTTQRLRALGSSKLNLGVGLDIVGAAYSVQETSVCPARRRGETNADFR